MTPAVLESLLDSPPPSPPANVPSLADNDASKPTTLRERSEGLLGDQLPPTLASLNRFRERVTIVSGLDHTTAPLAKEGGEHAKSSGCFLTSTTYVRPLVVRCHRRRIG